MPPVVYLLHGEDEFSIAQTIQRMEAKLGDPGSAVLDVARLDGRTISLDDLRSAAFVLPFMVRRRIVEVYHPLARLSSPALQEKFLALLNQVPASTALLLVEYRSLLEKSKKRVEKHWLLRWAEAAGERADVMYHPAPKAKDMPGKILGQAKEAGRLITPRAAVKLAELVGEDTRLANQELEKLAAYTNYRSVIEEEDVIDVVAAVGQANVFAMVDALGNQDARRATALLRRLLQEQDPISLFAMIVRQFRLLLLAREVIDGGGGISEVMRELGLLPFLAEKITAQARRFTLPTLEAIYRRLLEVDEAMKTGQMEGEVALEVLVAGLTAGERQSS